MTRTVILLRGINVSGKNKVPMAKLREVLTTAGFDDVATYIQSGNIAVDTNLDYEEMLSRIEALLVEHFDVDVPAVAVAQSDIAALEAGAPFSEDADPATSMIYFPLDEVDVAGVSAIEPERHPGDTITPTANAVYVFYGRGQSKTKLTLNHLERAARTTLTGRNLRSVAKLREL